MRQTDEQAGILLDGDREGDRFEIDRQAGIQACRQTDTEKEIEFG